MLTHPAASAGALHDSHLVLAPPADLRARPWLERLALPAARLLPRHGARVLVSRHPAVPEPAELVALAADPVPDPGRRAEHAPVGSADLLRPPLYPYYAERPRLGNLSALDDQAAAGVLMWVPGSVAYLVPLFVIGVRLLFGASETPSVDRVPRRDPNPGQASSPSPARPADHRAASPVASSRRPSMSCESRCWVAFSAGDTLGSASKSRCCYWPGSSSTMACEGRRSAR